MDHRSPQPLKSHANSRDADMTDQRKRWRLFCRSHKAASALEYTLVVGLTLAGIAGVLVAFANDVHTPIRDIGSKVSTVTTPTFDLDD